MVTEWQMYWITRLDGINLFCTIIAVLGGIALLMAFLINYLEDGELGKKLFICIPIWILLSIGAVLIPTTKEMIAIIAVPAIIQNEDVQEIPTNTAKFFNKKLRKWIEELEEE